jgi:hypothetical protein
MIRSGAAACAKPPQPWNRMRNALKPGLGGPEANHKRNLGIVQQNP